jgi:hypothetical protein
MRTLDNSLTMVYRTLNTSMHQVTTGLRLPLNPGLAVHSLLTSTFFPTGGCTLAMSRDCLFLRAGGTFAPDVSALLKSPAGMPSAWLPCTKSWYSATTLPLSLQGAHRLTMRFCRTNSRAFGISHQGSLSWSSWVTRCRRAACSRSSRSRAPSLPSTSVGGPLNAGRRCPSVPMIC